MKLFLVYCNSDLDHYCHLYSATEFEAVKVEPFEYVDALCVEDLIDLEQLIHCLNILGYTGSLAEVLELLK